MACSGKTCTCCPFPWGKASRGMAVDHSPPPIVKGCRRGTRMARVIRQGQWVWRCVTGMPASNRVLTVTDGGGGVLLLVTTAAPHGLVDEVGIYLTVTGYTSEFDISDKPSATTILLTGNYTSDAAGGSWQRIGK